VRQGERIVARQAHIAGVVADFGWQFQTGVIDGCVRHKLARRGLPEPFDAPCTPIHPLVHVAPLRVDLRPALQRQHLVTLDQVDVVGGMTPLPVFAQHDRVFGDIVAHQRVQHHALVVKIVLDQPPLMQRDQSLAQLTGRTQVRPE